MAETSTSQVVATLTVDQLESGLRRLAAQLAATECDFLELLAEFDRREGWGGPGMRSAAHWLSLHCGMTLGAARERVRVARCLGTLPLVGAAFAQGRLSYCKVRALSRVATPVTEPELLEIALAATGAQLERIVKHWRVTLIEEMSASSQLRRGLRRREDIDGSVIYTLRVAPEDAAILDAAIDTARKVVLDDQGRPVETPEETRLAAQLTDEPPATRASADAVVLLAETFLTTGLPAGVTPVEVVIHADLTALPALRGQADQTDTDEPEGADEADAADESIRATRPPTAQAAPDGTALAHRSRTLRPPTCTAGDGGQLSPTTIMRLLCNASVRIMVHGEGSPLDLGRSARHASHRQRRALKTRDGCCRFPGCTQTKRLIPHHVRWWTHGGRTDLDNLVLICPAHHRAVHDVGYTIAALGAGRFVFHRPDGAALPETGPPADPDKNEHTHWHVDDTTIAPTWAGERLDLDMLIGALAANTINNAGHHLVSIPNTHLPATLRDAAQWPFDDRAGPHGTTAA